MAFNAFSQSVFSMDAPCLPCCPEPCFYTLPPPDGDPPYADEPEAQDAIDNNTAGCLVYGIPRNDEFFIVSRAWSASVATNTLTVSDVITMTTAPGWSVGSTARVYLTASSGISGTYNFTGSGNVDKTNPFTFGEVSLDADDGTPIDDTGPLSLDASGSYSFSVPSDGYYFISANLSAQSAGGPGNVSLTCAFTADVGADGDICTIRAAYDDGGGGTAYLICV